MLISAVFTGKWFCRPPAEWEIKPEKCRFHSQPRANYLSCAKKDCITCRVIRMPLLQIGDGDHIAVKTGILTISDFRQKHSAAGGEGAPLALYGDVLLGSKPGENRILLNIGGIANLTFLPADGNYSAILCTDVGPGNTLIDAACRKYLNKGYDEDSKIAFAGNINEALLNELSGHQFFNEQPPKTTGPRSCSI